MPPKIPGDDDLNLPEEDVLDPNDPQDDLPEDQDDPADDAGDPQDDPADDAGDPQDDDQPDGQRRSQAAGGKGRENETIRRLRREKQAAERERDELRRQGQQLQQQRQAPQGETAQERAERRALMSPEERMNEDRLASESRVAAQLAHTQFVTQDAADRMEFNSKRTSSKLHARYGDEVETRLQELRAQNQNVSREALLKFIIGEKVMQKGNTGPSRQQREGQQRLRQQRAPAVNGRGDQVNSRGKSGNTPASRLADVEI